MTIKLVFIFSQMEARWILTVRSVISRWNAYYVVCLGNTG
jgi:hypothetical protein